MQIEDDELRRRITARTDDDLKKIVTNVGGEWTTAATRAAADELEERAASGRHIVDEPYVPEPVVPKPVYKHRFIGPPLSIRAFFWLSIGEIGLGLTTLAVMFWLVATEGLSQDELSWATWAEMIKVPIAVWVLVAIRARHSYVRWLLIAVTGALFVEQLVVNDEHVLDVALALTLWYLVKSRDLADYEQQILA